jgi:2-succinyl-6-hydroxy-2,4-cyclohexadiene-1-carboxylate synthase
MQPVTCLCGFAQSGETWGEVGELVGRGPWLALDLSATTLPVAVAEVVAHWDRMGIARSHLVGYSLGGRVALLLAATHPQRLLSLTAIGAHAGLEGPTRAARLAEDRELADRIERWGIEWFAGEWAGRPLFAGLARRGPAFLARLDAMRRRQRPEHLAAVLRGMGAGATEPFWDRLSAITVPTLLVAGAEDARYVALAQRLATAITGARVEIVPGAGHAVHLERPAEFARLLAAHLEAAEAPVG